MNLPRNQGWGGRGQEPDNLGFTQLCRSLDLILRVTGSC